MFELIYRLFCWALVLGVVLVLWGIVAAIGYAPLFLVMRLRDKWRFEDDSWKSKLLNVLLLLAFVWLMYWGCINEPWRKEDYDVYRRARRPVFRLLEHVKDADNDIADGEGARLRQNAYELSPGAKIELENAMRKALEASLPDDVNESDEDSMGWLRDDIAELEAKQSVNGLTEDEEKHLRSLKVLWSVFCESPDD